MSAGKNTVTAEWPLGDFIPRARWLALNEIERGILAYEAAKVLSSIEPKFAEIRAMDARATVQVGARSSGRKAPPGWRVIEGQGPA